MRKLLVVKTVSWYRSLIHQGSMSRPAARCVHMRPSVDSHCIRLQIHWHVIFKETVASSSLYLSLSLCISFPSINSTSVLWAILNWHFLFAGKSKRPQTRMKVRHYFCHPADETKGEKGNKNTDKQEDQFGWRMKGKMAFLLFKTSEISTKAVVWSFVSSSVRQSILNKEQPS